MVLLETSAYAVTYYVDFVSGSDTNNGTSTSTPWKRVKGMKGVTGTAANAPISGGDTIIFKGGVTWTASWPWTFVGGTSSMVTYTTNHSWFTGGAFTQPTFNDQAAHPGGTGMANKFDGGWVALNDVKFVNCGAPFVGNSDKCLIFENTHDIMITNSTFAPECWINIWFIWTSAGTYRNFTITGNDFSHMSGAIWAAPQTANVQVQNFLYNNNTFHDFESQVAGTHGDGAWHSYSAPSSDSSQYFNNMQFCNNRFYGNFTLSGGAMTAMFFAEGAIKNLLICNNDIAFTTPTSRVFDGLIVFSSYNNSSFGPVEIYNNSLVCVAPATQCTAAMVHTSTGAKNITMKNNIIATSDINPIWIEDSADVDTFTSDYNLWMGRGSTPLKLVNTYYSYDDWQGLGYDTHSSLSTILGQDPSWVKAPGNEHLNADSPARGVGVNLSNLGYKILNSDRDGVARGVTWDIGAYQFASGGAGGDVIPPAVPQNVIVR